MRPKRHEDERVLSVSLTQTLVSALLLLAMACGGTEVSAPTPTAKVAPPTESIEAHAARLAKTNIIVDGHIDLPYRLHNLREKGEAMPDLSTVGEEGDFDGARAKLGGLDAPFMSIYIPSKHQTEGGAKKLADELIDSVEAIAKKWPEDFAMASSPAEVRSNFEAGRVSLLLGIENGAAIEDDIKNVEHFFKRGVRYITLTHAKNNLICDSSYDETRKWNGLSDYGNRVVAEMNRLGILVDISHVSDETFYDVMKISTKPVIASHSSLRYFTPGFERNMNDDMVRALADNGGVVMINFGSTFISQTSIEWRGLYKKEESKFKEANKGADEKAVEAFLDKWSAENPFPYASVEDVANHIDRVVQLVGVDHVGFGSDYDGVGDSLPIGLKDAAAYPRLIAVLIERGYTDEQIAKICSGNLMRVWLAQNNVEGI
jgi:membrane dipeptidase